MVIEKIRQIKVAEELLKIITKKLKKYPNDESIDVDLYKNGRERGFSLSKMLADKQIVFSEYRSSDSIIVYYGNHLDFNINNIPTDYTYNNQVKQFKYNKMNDAANYIIKYITE